jgi:hypothetical protein
MTESERAALDHIRQVVDAVIGKPLPSEPSPSGTYASILPVPYFSPIGDEAGQYTSDSGAAAGVMLVRAYVNESITPADFFNQTGQSADNPLSFTQVMNALGVNAVAVELRGNLKLADLSLILLSGRPVIIPISQNVLRQSAPSPELPDGAHYVVVVGMDVKHVFIHDPLRRDMSGQALAIPWLTFYRAWTQALGYERAALVPRQQLVRRVCVTASVLEVHGQPGGADAISIGTVNQGDLFEVTRQKSGWGRIGEDRWINLTYTTDI